MSGATDVAGERVNLRTRPGVAFVSLHRPWWWVVPGIAALGAHYLAVWAGWPVPYLRAVALAWLALGLGWRVVAWLARSYTLTERRLLVRAGVISRVVGDVPLARVQHVTMSQSAAERLFGLGTVGVATAGSEGAAIHWLWVPRPEDVLVAIRAAVERERRGPVAPKVIGLAGGIGSGKSAVAGILGALGCVVIDSDGEAKAALDRPEVREQLVQWWGGSILSGDGRVDRGAVADIIFKDAAERRRLEALVHPIVRTRRDKVVQRVIAAGGAVAVVIDAPLLFEAGVDAECDTVVFVDSPREARLARVKATRGWDEAELGRREAGQMPLDEKRRRSRFVIENTGDADELGAKVRRTLDEILAA